MTIYEPESIPPLEFGSQNEVILQCDYDISDSEKGQLDLKWYFNDEVTPFLQWIPGGDRRPQLIEPTPFLGHVDLNYKIEDTEDENKAYKDLKILDLTPQMAGNYLCKVSTFEDEGYVHQQLNIFGKWDFLYLLFELKINILRNQKKPIRVWENQFLAIHQKPSYYVPFPSKRNFLK